MSSSLGRALLQEARARVAAALFAASWTVYPTDDEEDLVQLSTPSITPAQLAAASTFVAGQLVAWGLMDGARAQLVVAIASTAIAAAWKIADAVIRHGRARIAAAQETAQLVLEHQATAAAAAAGGVQPATLPPGE